MLGFWQKWLFPSPGSVGAVGASSSGRRGGGSPAGAPAIANDVFERIRDVLVMAKRGNLNDDDRAALANIPDCLVRKIYRPRTRTVPADVPKPKEKKRQKK